MSNKNERRLARLIAKDSNADQCEICDFWFHIERENVKKE